MTSQNQSTLPTLRISGRASEETGTFSIVITGDLCPRMRGEERILAGEENALLAKESPFLADTDLRIVQ